jgi:ArsR family transcriptional regulator, arsenate/arsenite/antimonite-responsive transcriptional repressor
MRERSRAPRSLRRGWDAVPVTTASLAAIEEPAALCCAPIEAPDLSPQESEATANLFKALADPTRVRIVNLLANSSGAVCVCDLNQHFSLSQPTISHHLKKLVAAGVLCREKRGTWAYFSVDQQAWAGLSQVLVTKRGTTR